MFTRAELTWLYYYIRRDRMIRQAYVRRVGLDGDRELRELDELETRIQEERNKTEYGAS